MTAVRNYSAIKRVVKGLDTRLTFLPRDAWRPLVHWRGGDTLPIHRWLRYREGFSPQLISELGISGRVLDPFCGAGAVLVGAAQAGENAIGIDVNPLATFAAGVKLSPLTPSQLRVAMAFERECDKIADQSQPWPLPGLDIARKVFEPVILDTVLRLRAAIENYVVDIAVRDFLRLAWIAILEEVGSYFKEGNGIKYRNRKRVRDGYEQRIDGEWQRERFGYDQSSFVLTCFRDQLSMMLSDTDMWKHGNWRKQRIMAGDALEVMPRLKDGSLDAIIFSPPYANRFDYFESMKVELWFGGFVHSYENLVALRKKSVRSHLGAQLSKPAEEVPYLEELISFIDHDSYAWRMRVPSLLRGYFHDMWQVIRSSRQLLKPGGKCHIIVGNSAYGGTIVPTDSLLAYLGLQSGFRHAEVAPVRHLTVAPQQRTALRGLETLMRESVVTLW